MLQSKRIPQIVPCPNCWAMVEVSNVIIEFGDAVVIPCSCNRCNAVVVLVETGVDEFAVTTPDIRQMEILRDALERIYADEKKKRGAKWN